MAKYMSFSNMLEILKEKNKRKIVIIKLGAFYIATEEDAVFLHEKIDLKCNCFKNNICKVGFPVNSLEKYIEKIHEIGKIVGGLIRYYGKNNKK